MNKSISKSTTRRFFLHHSQLPADLQVGSSYILDEQEGEILYQLTRVFRAAVGQNIILINSKSSNSTNTEFHFQIKVVNKKSLELELISLKQFQDPLPKQLSLGLCLPNKPAKLDFILEKATELGVSYFHLIKSDLSQFAHNLRPDRLEKIVLEAAEQSERAFVPTIKIHSSFDEFLKSSSGERLIALEHSDRSASLINHNIQADATIIVGPEGGFSEREVTLVGENKLSIINLGGSILKMDTAALLAVGIVALKLQQ